jgi:hypothetical protein
MRAAGMFNYKRGNILMDPNAQSSRPGGCKRWYYEETQRKCSREGNCHSASKSVYGEKQEDDPKSGLAKYRFIRLTQTQGSRFSCDVGRRVLSDTSEKNQRPDVPIGASLHGEQAFVLLINRKTS